LLPALREDLRARRLPAQRPAIRAVTRHRIERIGDGEDARTERDLMPAHAVRIALAVPTLVMRADDPQAGALQHRHAAEHLLAEHGVRLHAPPLAARERPRLL